MNRITIIIFLILLLIGCNKKNENKIMPVMTESKCSVVKTREDSLKQLLKIQDSIKVLEMTLDSLGNYAVFIDYNRRSDYYKVFDFQFSIDQDYEIESINNQLKLNGRRTSQSLRDIINKEYSYLLGTWMELYSLQDKLYVSSSCSFVGSYILSDSLFLDKYYMDGPAPYIIDKIEKVSSRVTRLTLFTETDKNIIVDFILIDKNKDAYIVVVKNKFDDDEIINYMTRTKSARNYDIVQHICTEETEMYTFDKVDFKGVLSGFKK